jgi:adenylate kinase family enzyme
VRRVVVVGPGAAGKSTLARALAEATGIPVTELDQVFWRPGLAAAAKEEWATVQAELVARPAWILDGDLGPLDVIEVRLRAADTVVFLDFSLVRCAWRAIRRSRENADFWRWLLAYRRRSRPALIAAIAAHAPAARVCVLRTPRAVRRFLANARRQAAGAGD